MVLIIVVVTGEETQSTSATPLRPIATTNGSTPSPPTTPPIPVVIIRGPGTGPIVTFDRLVAIIITRTELASLAHS